jgi:cytochrome bd-type quinol oxidase subunit 1
MEKLTLARIQFASTTLFHFIFVPLSIGLAFIIAVMETLYLVKMKEWMHYNRFPFPFHKVKNRYTWEKRKLFAQAR